MFGSSAACWASCSSGRGRTGSGPVGFLQTIADGIKLLLKEDIIPNNVDKTLYVLAPILMLIPALVTGGVIPWSPSLTWGAAAPNVNIGVLCILGWSSLAVYGVVLAGWSSNNKYALLGGLRSSAQMISYELGMGLAVVTVVLMSSSMGTHDIVFHQTDSIGRFPRIAALALAFPSGISSSCSRWVSLPA